MSNDRAVAWVGTVLVAVHGLVNAAHGMAHLELGVENSNWQQKFILVVIWAESPCCRSVALDLPCTVRRSYSHWLDGGGIRLWSLLSLRYGFAGPRGLFAAGGCAGVVSNKCSVCCRFASAGHCGGPMEQAKTSRMMRCGREAPESFAAASGVTVWLPNNSMQPPDAAISPSRTGVRRWCLSLTGRTSSSISPTS